LCQFYRRQYGVLFHAAMPTNLYGPGDNYHPEDSHVLPALLHRFHTAKVESRPSVEIWGTGKPRREFLYVDDLANAIVHLLSVEQVPDWVNVGTGVDISIGELAEKVREVVGYRGRIEYDQSKPDGTLLKRTDTSLMRSLGWEATISLDDGLRQTYHSYISELETATIRR
jgi:GDP-L-fucose synthase